MIPQIQARAFIAKRLPPPVHQKPKPIHVGQNARERNQPAVPRVIGCLGRDDPTGEQMSKRRHATLFRLREKHQHPGPLVRFHRVYLLLRIRNREPIARLIVNGLPIHEEHVMMRPMSLDVMYRHMP